MSLLNLNKILHIKIQKSKSTILLYLGYEMDCRD